MNKLLKNFSYAIVAQGISYILSIITGLVIPKMLGVTEYGYWQLFVFYGSYMNFGMLGIHDGMYLRLGGKQFSSLNFQSESDQFKSLMIFQCLLGTCIICSSLLLGDDISRIFVMMNLGFYIVLINACQYLGELFQAVNDTPIYSKATMINKVFYAVVIVVLLVLRIYDFRYYIIGLNLSALASVIYYIYHGRKLVVRRFKTSFKNVITNMISDLKSGCKIMIGGYAAMLILGAGRGFIDLKWGITTFGKLSVSISLINLIMQFINQISIVLFPALKTISVIEQKKIYLVVRKGLYFVLPIVYIMFYPLSIIISKWLPDYSESTIYLSILLPICVFDAKSNILGMTYLKVLRRETSILLINVISCFFSIAFTIIGTFVLENIYFILCSIVVACLIRNILFDYYLNKEFENNAFREMIVEILIMISFIICNLFITSYSMIINISLILIFVYYLDRKDLKEMIYHFNKKIKGINR